MPILTTTQKANLHFVSTDGRRQCEANVHIIDVFNRNSLVFVIYECFVIARVSSLLNDVVVYCDDCVIKYSALCLFAVDRGDVVCDGMSLSSAAAY